MELKVGDEYIYHTGERVKITAVGEEAVLYKYVGSIAGEQCYSKSGFTYNFKKPKKKVTKWINLYPSINLSGYTCYGNLYESEAEAKKNEAHKVSIQVKVEFEVDQK